LCRTGIFEKLQQVMQKEKERDIDFSKKLQAGARPDGKSFAFTLSTLSLLSPFKTSLLHRLSFIVGFFFLFIFGVERLHKADFTFVYTHGHKCLMYKEK
jgi:hypothetical protein